MASGERTKKAETGDSRAAKRSRKPAARGTDAKVPESGQHRPRRSPERAVSAMEVVQVRLRPDEMADLRQVMDALNLPSLSDALREGLRLLSRNAAEVAAAKEIRTYYHGAPAAPTPVGVAPATSDELSAADEIQW